MIPDLILIIFFFSYAALLFYYKRGWQSLSEFIPAKNNGHSFISVIVAARNEEKHIGSLLQALAQQSYPKEFFEIIVVDDYSTDNTADVVQGFAMQNLSLMRPAVSENSSSKKRAIEAGIQNAKGELIVTTDADCLPVPTWLRAINDFYVQQKACFIAAPVKYSNDKSLLQLFQSLDFLTLQGITAASVARDAYAMCNGANLAYKKQSFTEVNGFAGIDKVATGDDMLLMHKIWKRNPGQVFYLKTKNAIVMTEPMLSWKDFFMQRRRWASKTFVYDDYKIVAVLVFIYAFNFLFFILLAAAFFNPFYGWYLIGYLLLKTIIEWPFVSSVATFFDERQLMRYFIFFQPLHIVYTVIVGALSQFGKYEWKGRKTK